MENMAWAEFKQTNNCLLYTIAVCLIQGFVEGLYESVCKSYIKSTFRRQVIYKTNAINSNYTLSYNESELWKREIW